MMTVPELAVAQQLPTDLFNAPIDGSVAAWIIRTFGLLTVLSVAPGILIMVTSFPRFVIAFSILRSGMGLASTPSNMILTSLALFMTFYVMAPTMDRAWTEGVQPLLENRMTEAQAVQAIAESTAAASEQVARIESLKEQTGSAAERISGMSGMMAEVSDLVASAAASASQQSSAAEDVARNVAEISRDLGGIQQSVGRTAQDAAGAAGEVERAAANIAAMAQAALEADSSARELAKLSGGLQGLAHRSDLGKPGVDVGVVKTAHLAWRSRLEAIIGGFSAMKPEEVADHHQCAFGKWFDTEGNRSLGSFPAFREVGGHHERIHALARQVVKLMHEKRADQAKALMREFEEVREKLFAALDRLYMDSFGETK